MITNHTQLLNYLITRYDLKSYLEIGVNDPSKNFDLIKCEHKIGVDPEVSGYKRIYKGTSDIFFNDPNLSGSFDIIFIDGLHHADQVRRDFENSLRCLNEGGYIVIHDTWPQKEETTIVPRQSRVWHGNVYQFIMTLDSYAGINHLTLPIDEGCTIVWKNADTEACPCIFGEEGVTWQKYLDYRDRYYNLVDVSMLENVLPERYVTQATQ